MVLAGQNIKLVVVCGGLAKNKLYVQMHADILGLYLCLSSVQLIRVELLMKLHLKATESHLLYGIMQCYLPSDTSDQTPP